MATTVNHKKSAMVPSDRAIATFYKLSIVTMFLFAAVCPQVLIKKFSAISGHISETARNRAKVAIDH